MVALLDAPDVASVPRKWRWASQRIRSFSTVFHKDESVRFDQLLPAVVSNSLSKAKNLTSYLIGSRLRKPQDETRMRLPRYCLDRGIPLNRLLEGIPVQTVCLFAEREYRPAGQFTGELVLFRASSGEAADEPFAVRYDDPLFGWGPRSTRGVQVYDVSGGHFSMLQEPNVRVLAEQIQLYLERALAGDKAAPALVRAAQ